MTAMTSVAILLACFLSWNGLPSAQGQVRPTTRPVPRHRQYIPVHLPPPTPQELYCGRGETYNPMEQICCHARVLPLVGPPQFGQCCQGEAIDNRTETCCMGREKASYDQACCGYEAYDLLNGELCCGERYIYEAGLDMCCNGYLAPHIGHICCDNGPVAVKGNPATSACCGCGAVSTDTHVCCDGVSVKIGSDVEACCGGTTIHNPSTSVCCPTKGLAQVVQGRACKPSAIGITL